MVRRTAVIAVFCVVWAAGAAGDIVYMKGGKTYRGEVTVQGDRVLIKMPLGTVGVEMKDVVRIVKTEPETAPAHPTVGRLTLPTFTPRTRLLSADEYEQPESACFLSMRQVRGETTGVVAYQLREQVKLWRAKAHDRARRLDRRWLLPADITRARESFAEMGKKAQDAVREIRRHRAVDTPQERALQARYERAVALQLRQAAGAWADPLLRNFLTAAANLMAKDYETAGVLFKRCQQDAPRIAGFWQGEAMAWSGRKEPLKALAAYTEALRLQPDSREALELVRQAMKDTPGAMMDKPAYVAAKEMVDCYEEAGPTGSYTRRGSTWLMPGREWTAADYNLPMPPVDRFVFLQALGVPVGKDCLLVDAKAVQGALAVHVALEDGTIVSAQVGRGGSYSSRKDTAALLLVRVEDCEFTPLAVESAAKPAEGQAVKLYGLNLYEEMGSTVRPESARVAKVGKDGVAGLAGWLAPGEAAGPVLGEAGQLLGFLAGRTDAAEDDGGGDTFLPISQAAGLLRQAERSTSSYSSYRRAKRTIVPKPAGGQVFIVYAIHGELAKEQQRR